MVNVLHQEDKKKSLVWQSSALSRINYFGFLCLYASASIDSRWGMIRHLTWSSLTIFLRCDRFLSALNPSPYLGKQIHHGWWCNVVCTIKHLWWAVAWNKTTTSASLCAGRVYKPAYCCNHFCLCQHVWHAERSQVTSVNKIGVKEWLLDLFISRCIVNISVHSICGGFFFVFNFINPERYWIYGWIYPE